MKNPVFIKGLVLAALIIIADQASKFYLLNILGFTPETRMEIAPFLNVVLVWNKGISFGMGNSFAQAQLIFLSVAIIIVLVLLIWLYRIQESFVGFALGLLIGGAGGNIFDRITQGQVLDFLDFHFASYHWPAFNLADSAVCVGALMLVSKSMFNSEKNVTIKITQIKT